MRIAETEDDYLEIQLGRDGTPLESPISERPFVVSELDAVSEFCLPIGPVQFEVAGTYEFQLWIDGIEEPIGRERVFAREYNHDE